MEENFTVSTGWKTFYGALAAALIIFALFLVNVIHSSGNSALLIILVLFFAIGCAILYNLYKRKVTVSSTGIGYTTLFGTKQLFKDEIKGFRVGQKAIIIEPKTSSSKIRIDDYTILKNYKDLVQCLDNNYADLNKEEYEKQKSEILSNELLGATTADRESKVKQAVLYTQIYTYVGMGVFFSVMYFHPDNNLFTYGLLLYPLIGIWLFANGKGIIKLFNKKNNNTSAYPSIALGIFFPAVALIMKTILDIHILALTNFGLPFAVTGIIVFFILYFSISKGTSVSLTGDIIFAIIISFTYAGGSILEINSQFDNSGTTIYTTTVISQHISHGKSTTYYLDLSEWGPDHISGNVTVPESFYNKVGVGNTVRVNVKKGELNIPWYYLSL